jgi:pyruvate formate lyase activating enzyme
MTRDTLDDAKGLLDAANVDLKAFSEDFYLKRCRARLKGVMDSLVYMKKLGIWLEVTTLLIPGLNDDQAELRSLARFLKSELGPETPWHVSRFYPNYKERGIPPTDAEFLRTVRQIGLEAGLYYVYTGNLPWEQGEETVCPECSYLLIRRAGYTIVSNRVSQGRCPKCGHAVDGLEL